MQLNLFQMWKNPFLNIRRGKKYLEKKNKNDKSVHSERLKAKIQVEVDISKPRHTNNKLKLNVKKRLPYYCWHWHCQNIIWNNFKITLYTGIRYNNSNSVIKNWFEFALKIIVVNIFWHSTTDKRTDPCSRLLCITLKFHSNF